MLPHQTYQTDYVFKYWPRYDSSTYLQQMDYTDNALSKYFPSSINHQLNVFKQFKIGAIFVSTFLIGAICYKLEKFPGVRRITTPWVPGALKIGLLLGGVYLINQFLEGPVTREFHISLYEQFRPNYRAYKFSGDMLRLNPNVEFEELPPRDKN